MGRYMNGDCSIEVAGDLPHFTMTKDVQLVNLETLVQDWVEDFPLDKIVRKEADDLSSSDFNWSHVRFYHGVSEYSNQLQTTLPTPHVLFSAIYTNDTDREQCYTVKTDRRTKSTCSIMMERAYTIGHDVKLPIVAPNPVIEANAGLKGEMTVQRVEKEIFEEDLVWSVDNQIAVPVKYSTRVELLLKECEYSGEFKVETRMEGKVHVTLRSKKDASVLMLITADVRNIFRANKMFTVKTDGVYFESRGRCNCRFGIEQHVKLSQMALAEIVESAEEKSETSSSL